jgi:hypothetical protein
MKHYYYLFLILFLFGCDDNYKDIYRYSKEISQSKDYPVYLDMSEIGNIQVMAKSPQLSPFKILSNDNYYFVGDMLKGIHVYEKKAGTVNYLCFIECRYIKGFELVDNRIFCNNFVDLVVLDVSNPLKTHLLHRQVNYFNRFSNNANYWNIPYEEGKGIIVGSEKHALTGTVTEKQPNLDFNEYDMLYGNLTTKILPEKWFSIHPENDKPYIGIIRLGTDEIYSYGTYGSWAICTFRSGTFSSREENLWTTPRGKYAPPYYYSNAYPKKMFFQDSLIYILGVGYGNTGYSDCTTYNESYPFSYQLYFSSFRPIDITYMPTMRAFFVLSGNSVWGAFKKSDPTEAYMDRYIDYKISTDATSIFSSGNNLITLGNELKVYAPSENELKLVKDYPNISGTCYSKEGNMVAVANAQGLFFYDFSDLNNIILIP